MAVRSRSSSGTAESLAPEPGAASAAAGEGVPPSGWRSGGEEAGTSLMAVSWLDSGTVAGSPGLGGRLLAMTSCLSASSSGNLGWPPFGVRSFLRGGGESPSLCDC